EPQRILRRDARHKNPPDNEVVGEHVIIIVPRACRSAVEDEPRERGNKKKGPPRGSAHFLIIHSGMLASMEGSVSDCYGVCYLVTGGAHIAPLRFFRPRRRASFSNCAPGVFPNGIMALLFSASPPNSWRRLASQPRTNHASDFLPSSRSIRWREP